MAEIKDIGKITTDTQDIITKTTSDKDALNKSIAASKTILTDFYKKEIAKIGDFSFNSNDEARQYIETELDRQDNMADEKDQSDKKNAFVESLNKATKKYEDTRKKLINAAYNINQKQNILIKRNETIIEELEGQLLNIENTDKQLDKDIIKITEEIKEKDEAINELKTELATLKSPEDQARIDDIDEEIKNYEKEVVNLTDKRTDKKDEKGILNFDSKKTDLEKLVIQNEELIKAREEFFKEFESEFDEINFEEYVPQKSTSKKYNTPDKENDDTKKPYDPNKSNGEKKDGEQKPYQPSTPKAPSAGTSSNNVVAAPQQAAEQNFEQNTDIVKSDVILGSKEMIESYIAMAPQERRKALNTSGYEKLIDAMNSDNLKLTSKQKKSLKNVIKEDQDNILESINIETSKDDIKGAFDLVGIKLEDKMFDDIYGSENPNIVFDLKKMDKDNLKTLQSAMENFYTKVGENKIDPKNIENFNKYIGNFVKQGQLQNSSKDITGSPITKILNKFNKFSKNSFAISELNKTICNGENKIDQKLNGKKDMRNEIAKQVKGTQDISYLNDRTSIQPRQISTQEQVR